MPTSSAASPPSWLASATALISKFAADHSLVLKATERQLSASFEIGCLLSLLAAYKSHGYALTLQNIKDGEFRYLTTPSGNPENFSYVSIKGADGELEVRQQVRIESHVDPDIRFTPDIVVLVKDSTIDAATLPEFAAGRRKMFSVKSHQVVAAHECKSMNPFPELMVNFIGMLVAAHSWHPNGSQATKASKGHLAPTLFVGGTARPIHMNMIAAMERAYVLNIVVGMHAGVWNLDRATNRFRWTGPGSPAPTPPVVPKRRMNVSRGIVSTEEPTS